MGVVLCFCPLWEVFLFCYLSFLSHLKWPLEYALLKPALLPCFSFEEDTLIFPGI
jgi:hypothetical protein